jgi:hypothetical protein
VVAAVEARAFAGGILVASLRPAKQEDQRHRRPRQEDLVETSGVRDHR